jgi:hypothetical protein
MAPERRRLIVLLGLLAILLPIAIYQYWPQAPQAGGAALARPGARGPAQPGITAPDVHLRALNEPRESPGDDPQRNLFRFKPKAPPPRPAAPPRPSGTVEQQPSGPPPPTGPPPITMRFIGIVESTGQSQKIAILSDGRGVYQGREGDIIEGRYRILRIGVESVEMAYLDGRGRQTIRLSGS